MEDIERKEGTYKGLVAFDKDKEEIDHKAYPLSKVFDMGGSPDCYTVFCKGLFHPLLPRIVVKDRKAWSKDYKVAFVSKDTHHLN